jgi:flagellar biogenesis protein FliO
MDDSELNLELSEEDLLEMDRQFLESMNEKNIEHASEDATNQQTFFIFLVFMFLLVLGLCLAVYWIVQGRRIRKRRKTRVILS